MKLRAPAHLAALAALAIAGGASAAAAQTPTTVGVVGGVSSSDPQWSRATDTDRVSGALLGAFARVRTPWAPLAVRAEGAWVRRGGDAMLDAGGVPASGGVRVDYLEMSVVAELGAGLGPARAWVAFGPSTGVVLGTELDPILRQVLDREHGSTFGVVAGVGMDVALRDLSVGVEARRFEGLSDALSGDVVSLRNRAHEAVVRVGVPLDLLRSR